jgi:hypothetical protein
MLNLRKIEMPQRAKLELTGKENKPHNVGRASLNNRHDPAQVSLLPLKEISNLSGVYSPFSHSARIEALQQLQQTSGNTAVQRYLLNLYNRQNLLESQDQRTSSNNLSLVQSQKGAPGSQGKAEEKTEEGGAKTSSFNLDKWISTQVYDLVKEQVGKDKLNEYANDLGKQAWQLLIKQLEGLSSTQDMVDKQVYKDLGEVFGKNIESAAQEIMKSPAGVRLKTMLLEQTRQNPASIIGLVLTALAIAAVNNVDIPTISLKQNLGKGFHLETKAELGKFREMALKQVKLGIGYSSSSFQTSLSGGYVGEKQKPSLLSMRTAAAATKEEIKLMTNPNLTSTGEMTFDFSIKNISAKASLLYGGPKQWLGVWEFKLGEKYSYWAPKFVVGPDQKVTFSLGYQFMLDNFALFSAVFPEGRKTQMSHYLNIENPFGTKGLKIEGSLRYQVQEPKILGAKLTGQYKLLEKSPSHPFPVLYLKIEGAYQAAEGKQKNDFSGLLVLWGSW